MQQRREKRGSLDDFPTPPWAGRALMEHVILPMVGWTGRCSLWEPAVNRGFLLRGLRDYFNSQEIHASDIFDYGIGAQRGHFLFQPVPGPIDFIITNPPYDIAQGFIHKSLDQVNIGAAFLVRTSFIEGVNRYEQLWSRKPPTFIAQFAERVPIVKGRCSPDATSATSYCWIGWINGWEHPPRLLWIPPCRRELERPGDYQRPGKLL